MGDVFTMDLSVGRAQKLTDINPQLHDMKLGDLEPVSWKSFDGKEIWGLLLTPPGYQGGKRLTDGSLLPRRADRWLHATEFFRSSRTFPGKWIRILTKRWRAPEWRFSFPMPRGGSGYGVAGFRAIVNRWGEDDYKDIMAGVDSMVAKGIADPDRLGVMGASYGGFMTSWIVTQTGRFKAASTGASVNDLIAEYYLSDAGDFIVEYYGYPWEDTKALVEHSPLTHAQNVTTPLLIQHGENDYRVPLSQARRILQGPEDAAQNG